LELVPHQRAREKRGAESVNQLNASQSIVSHDLGQFIEIFGRAFGEERSEHG
jgi:hypothetical protein